MNLIAQATYVYVPRNLSFIEGERKKKDGETDSNTSCTTNSLQVCYKPLHNHNTKKNRLKTFYSNVELTFYLIFAQLVRLQHKTQQDKTISQQTLHSRKQTPAPDATSRQFDVMLLCVTSFVNLPTSC